MRANRTGVSGLKEEDIQASEGSFSWDMEPEGEGEVGSGKARGQHAFSVKGQVINILGAKGQMVPVAATQLCHETGSPGLDELSCAPGKTLLSKAEGESMWPTSHGLPSFLVWTKKGAAGLGLGSGGDGELGEPHVQDRRKLGTAELVRGNRLVFPARMEEE